MLLLAFLLFPVALMADGVNALGSVLVDDTTNMTDKTVKVCLDDGTYSEPEILSMDNSSVNFCDNDGWSLKSWDYYTGDQLASPFVDPPGPFTLHLTQLGVIIFGHRGSRPISYIVRTLDRSNHIKPIAFFLVSDIGVPVVIMNFNTIERLGLVSIEDNNNITALDLQENSIEVIDVGCFQNMRELLVLNLGWNEIKSLEKNVFTGLEKIETISLSRNKLTKCATDMFTGLPNSLIGIHLQYNDIEIIEVGCFNSSSQASLSMTGNKLTVLDRNSFDGLPNVTWLVMGKNNITRVCKYTTRSQKRLEKLDLIGNSIEEMEEGCLSGCLRKDGCIVDVTRSPETEREAKKFPNSFIRFHPY